MPSKKPLRHWLLPLGFVALAIVFVWVAMPVLTGIGFSLAASGSQADRDASGRGTVKSGLSYPALLNQKNPPLLNFVAMGDTGSGMLNQKRITKQLMAEQQASGFKLLLILGDVVYSYTNKAKYFNDGQTFFHKEYQPLRDKGVKILPIIGNHDVLYDYSKQLLDFLGMPASYYDYTVGPVHFFALDTNSFDGPQAEWLKNRLTATAGSSPWQIVYGHHPVFSSGSHGNNDHLKTTLWPVLIDHHVDLYLSGHDHDYERFKPKSGVVQIVSGGGGAGLRKFKKIKADSAQHFSKLHLLKFEVSPTSLTMTVVDDQGHVLDTLALNKSSAKPVPKAPNTPTTPKATKPAA